jgi:hypothetical protein
MAVRQVAGARFGSVQRSLALLAQVYSAMV